jgi:hypothetical protein
MNNVKRAMEEVKEEGPQLRVVAAANGARKRITLSAPLVLPSLNRTRRPRSELIILGWGNRAIRLAGRK